MTPLVTQLGLGAGGALVLRRMRGEFRSAGRLTPATTVAMYGAYAAHASAFLQCVKARGFVGEAGRSEGAVARRAAGVTVAAVGGAVSAAGMGRFQGPSQLSGTSSGALVDGGVYRLTRNPQYVGYSLLLAGTAVATGSRQALVLAVGAAAAFAWWVPVEEAALEAAFGPDYRAYRARTRRWL